MKLSDEIPADVVLAMTPEDLAAPLLTRLAKRQLSNPRLHRGNFGNECRADYGHNDRITHAFLEAWGVLEREGLLTRIEDDWYVVSDRGKSQLGKGVDNAFQFSSLLPKQLLHPNFLPKVRNAFLRGDYRSAVRDAFLELEVAVRSAGSFPKELTGEDLMKEAFHVDRGKLTDHSLPPAERKGMMFTFVGAFAFLRNPPSHRHVNYEPQAAAQVIVLASHLLSIVDDPSSHT